MMWAWPRLTWTTSKSCYWQCRCFNVKIKSRYYGSSKVVQWDYCESVQRYCFQLTWGVVAGDRLFRVLTCEGQHCGDTWREGHWRSSWEVVAQGSQLVLTVLCWEETVLGLCGESGELLLVRVERNTDVKVKVNIKVKGYEIKAKVIIDEELEMIKKVYLLIEKVHSFVPVSI